MHLKRQNIGKFWPVPRKGTKYLAVSTHNQKNSMPLVVIMRDVLKLVRNKKELKKILNEKQIEINGKTIRETNYPLALFDVLFIRDFNKNYRVILSKKNKMELEEISKDIDKKIIKIVSKKILKKGALQLNLSDGRNIIFKGKANVNVGDSIVFNFKENKLDKILKLEKGNKCFVFLGMHAGLVGNIENIVEKGGKKIVVIKNDKKINVLIKNIIVIEENER